MSSMKLIKLNNRGDTIVEVLLAIAVVSSVIGASFVSANRSLKGTQASQERAEALKLAEGQVEYLQNLNSTASENIFDTTNTLFCVLEGNRVNFSGNTLPALDADDFSIYPTECQNYESSRYNLSISYDPDSQDTFTIRSRWEGPTGNDEEVRLIYRAHERINTTGGETACPTGENDQLNINFPLSGIALNEAGGDPNVAVNMIDTLANNHASPTTFARNFSDPDLDLGAHTAEDFEVAGGCVYRISYELYCGAAAPLTAANFENPPDPAIYCQPPQENETFRASFYAGSSGNQCDYSTLLGYIDVGDLFVGSVSSSVISGAEDVTIVNPPAPGNSVSIACMEMRSGCNTVGYVSDTVLCPAAPSNPANDFYHSSVFWNEMTWRQRAAETPF